VTQRTIVVNGRTVLPFALIDAEWLAEHPGWMSEAVGAMTKGHV
jgi:hypothetical protein